MLVMVTGAFGYLGMALLKRLSSEHEIFAVGRTPRASTKISLADLQQKMVVIESDADILAADTIPTDIDAVVHLAGGGASGGDLTDAAASLNDNVCSVAHVAAILPARVRRIFASSIYVYGQSSRPCRSVCLRPSVETDRCAPDTLYGAHKFVAESVWKERGGVSLRFAHLYGAGSGIDFGRDGVTERLARARVHGSKFEIHGSGQQKLDLVHVDDACEAVARALECSTPLPPAINIGGGYSVSIAALTAVFGIEGDQLKCVGDTMSIDRSLDISLAERVLGWTPVVPIVSGARGLVDMVKEHEARQ